MIFKQHRLYKAAFDKRKIPLDLDTVHFHSSFVFEDFFFILSPLACLDLMQHREKNAGLKLVALLHQRGLTIYESVLFSMNVFWELTT